MLKIAELLNVEPQPLDGEAQEITPARMVAVIDENNCQEFMNDNLSVNVIKTSEQYHNFHRFTAVGQTEFLAVLESGIAELQSDGTLDDLLQNYGLK